MSITQFAMVEELAFLVKDNLPCKHLVLTMEELLVNYLQAEDTSSDGILELKPMNSYNRFLLHRLAEIFGFEHESAGQGEYRHLILERCPDTSIPPILVSDILGMYDEPQSSIASHQILRRKEASPVSQTNTASIQQTQEERKAAYLLARERIFSMNLEEAKEPDEQKPQSVPLVARQLIAHALGQRINTKNPNELVEELALLVKDNLPCKHLVLTMEDFLVNYLQAEDTSSDGILELEPMNSYNRLLLHRLAEIFGFAHESAGGGEYRHLILERRPDASIPPILVSDILGTYDEPQSLVTSHQILRRKEASPVSQTNTASIQQTLEERKAAYLLARERIFSMNLEEAKEPCEQKPQSVPVVARRMITHALGQRINTKNPNDLVSDSLKDRVLTDELNAQDNNSEKSYPTEDYEESSQTSRTRNTGSSTSIAASPKKCEQSGSDKKPVNKDSPPLSRDGKQGESVSKEYMKREHLGAAKRMFAHALGVHSGNDSSVPRSRKVQKMEDTEYS